METLIPGGGIYTPSATVTHYYPLYGNPTYASPTDCYQVIPCPGKLSNLFVWTQAAPGAANSRRISVYKNGVATSLSVTLAGASQNYGENTSNSVDVVAGDLVCIEHVPSGVPSVYPAQYCVVFTATTLGESLILGNTVTGAQGELDDTNTEYAMPATGGAYLAIGTMGEPIPTDGKFSALYVKLDGAPDAGGSDGYTFTLQVNGVDKALTVTIIGNNTTGNVTADVDLVPGDIVKLKIAPSGTPAGTPHAHWGFVWVPDKGGEAIVLGEIRDHVNYESTWHTTPAGWSTGLWLESITGRLQPTWSAVISKLYVNSSVAPGSGASRTYTLLAVDLSAAPIAGTSPFVTISDSGLGGSYILGEQSLPDYSRLTIRYTSGGAPASSETNLGFVLKLSKTYPPSPACDLTRVTAIRHIYRPGLFRMEVTLGDVQSAIDMMDTKVRKEIGAPSPEWLERFLEHVGKFKMPAGREQPPTYPPYPGYTPEVPEPTYPTYTPPTPQYTPEAPQPPVSYPQYPSYYTPEVPQRPPPTITPTQPSPLDIFKEKMWGFMKDPIKEITETWGRIKWW